MSRIDDYHKVLEKNAVAKEQFARNRKDLRIQPIAHGSAAECVDTVNEALRSAEFEALFMALLERRAVKALEYAKNEAAEFMADKMPLEKPGSRFTEVPS